MFAEISLIEAGIELDMRRKEICFSEDLIYDGGIAISG